VYVLNDPYNGGTHLPDVTVVSPVFDEAGEEVYARTVTHSPLTAPPSTEPAQAL
jgi:N-methylhydantoinase B/oxoprolinase/acetone carboxylase alpha subunit